MNTKSLSPTVQSSTSNLRIARPHSLSVRDPVAYAALMDTASDPRFLASAMQAGASPQTYLSFLQRLRDPEALHNGFKTVTPQTAMDWAYSAIDPEFQKALLSRAADPHMGGYWMKAMRDSAYFQSAVAVFDVPMRWMKVEADGHLVEPLVNWLDPQTYKGWMRLMAQPLPKGAQKSASDTVTTRPLAFLTPPQRY